VWPAFPVGEAAYGSEVFLEVVRQNGALIIDSIGLREFTAHLAYVDLVWESDCSLMLCSRAELLHML